MTTTELAVVAHDEAALSQLNRHAVVALLERGKTWLQQALERDTELGELITYKEDAAVLRELTIQKELGRDAQLAATELVRRAERAIGQAVRKGQERGEIRRRGDGLSQVAHRERTGQEGHPEEETFSSTPPSVTEATGYRHASALSRIYELTDGVTDEQFDEAVEEARSEGNLAHANVVRKLKRRGLRSESPRPEPLRRTRRLDSRKIITGIVESVENPVSPSLLAEVDFDELEEQDLREWISSLSESIRALQSLRNRLKKELTRS